MALAVGGAFGAASVVVAGLIDGQVRTIAAAFLLGALFAVISVASYLLSIRPSIETTDRELLIRNPLRAYALSWREIDLIVPGYYGLTIYRKNGRSVRAVAAQKSSWAAARKKDVRADRISRQLAERVALAVGTESAAIVPSSEERVAIAGEASQAIRIGLAVLILVIVTVLRVASVA